MKTRSPPLTSTKRQANLLKIQEVLRFYALPAFNWNICVKSHIKTGGYCIKKQGKQSRKNMLDRQIILAITAMLIITARGLMVCHKILAGLWCSGGI